MAGTAFDELNAVLRELVSHAQSVLGGDLLGAYLVGSFAIGDADLHSDCDFLIVVRQPLSSHQEAAFRALHQALPAREGHWNRHLEGSYPVVEDLRSLDRLGREWLYIDHGHATMEWSTHCNNPVHRWTLRERGVTLIGPDPRSFACEVPADALREHMRVSVQTFLPDLFTWIDFRIAWAQRYAVATLCRMLYTIQTGTVCSKRRALLWGMDSLHPRWRELLQNTLDDRVLGLDFNDAPRPGSVEETILLAAHVKQLSTQGA